MKIVISGLGIIGGSYAKAIKKYTEHTVIGINRSKKPLELALACGAIDREGTAEDLRDADMLILGTYPKAAVEFIEKNGEYINKDCIVTDTCGIKSEICGNMVHLSEKFGFTFVGTHPMAGKEINGFSASDSELFQGASCIIVPCHKGFSAGSYRDVSRVAKINAELWTELFLENKAPLLSELDTLIDNLSRIRNNIANEDYQSLYRQLQAGRAVKEELNE